MINLKLENILIKINVVGKEMTNMKQETMLSVIATVLSVYATVLSVVSSSVLQQVSCSAVIDHWSY